MHDSGKIIALIGAAFNLTVGSFSASMANARSEPVAVAIFWALAFVNFAAGLLVWHEAITPRALDGSGKWLKDLEGKFGQETRNRFVEQLAKEATQCHTPPSP